MNGPTGGQMGGMGGAMAPMGQMGGGQHHQQQQHAMYQHPPVANTNHAAAAGADPMAGMAGGMGHGNMGGVGAFSPGAGMNGSMMGGVPGGMGGVGGGGFPGGPAAAQQRPAKKVPDWLIQTMKEKEKQAEKQKKKEGISLSTDVAASLSGGADTISGYNLVHSPSPSPPGSPSARRTKPSWQDDDSDDDSADEVSPTRANREKKASNGSAAADGGAGTRNGAKPSGILKKGGTKKKRGSGRVLEGGNEETEAAEASGGMDEETKASFDREIRRLLTHLLKGGTTNITHEVASSALEDAHHSAAQQTQQRQQQQQPKVKRKEQREQKKAMGALIGGYGSESGSDSDGDASPPQATAPAATVSGDASRSVAVEGALGGSPRSAVAAAAGAARSPAPTRRKAPVMVGGKWQLPEWADPPHEAPLPAGLSIVVETIGPDLERVKTQELSFSTTVMGRFEEQCGFLVEDSSASRCHAAIL